MRRTTVRLLNSDFISWKISLPSTPRTACGSFTATGPTATQVMDAWVGLEKGSSVAIFSTAERE
jgi:hypothetical protein